MEPIKRLLNAPPSLAKGLVIGLGISGIPVILTIAVIGLLTK